MLSMMLLAAGVSQAAVTIDRELPKQAWQSACRSQLVQPYTHKVRAALAEQLGFAIADNVGYFAGDVQGFRIDAHTDTEVRCSGTVIAGNQPANLSGTAVRAAWQQRDELSSAQLKSLLQVALADSAGAADAVALIASTAAAAQQVSYLDANLDAGLLQLDQARAAVMRIYLDAGRWDDALAVAAACGAVDCRRMLPAAQQGKRRDDAQQATDLQSYF